MNSQYSSDQVSIGSFIALGAELQRAYDEIAALKQTQKEIASLLHSMPIANKGVEEIRRTILDKLEAQP